MSVPESIRKVERPTNSIVYKIKEGVYGVHKRAGVKYNSKGKPQPINGIVIGHIINEKYISLVDSVSDIPLFLSY